MRLERYLREKDISVAEFAKSVGILRTSAYRYLYGYVPTRRVVEEIYRITRGAVQPNDFYDLNLRKRR